MTDIREWIEAQLKKGYSASYIKSFLISKGYPQKAIDEVDRISYIASSAKTLPSKKIAKKVSYKPVALVSIVIAIVFLVWLFNALLFSSKQQNLCDKFKEAEYAISCEEAVALALADKPGNIQDISVGTKKISAESEGKILRKDINLWLIDIRLDKPFYDKNFDKEIKLLRVGIGTDEHFGMYREIIK